MKIWGFNSIFDIFFSNSKTKYWKINGKYVISNVSWWCLVYYALIHLALMVINVRKTSQDGVLYHYFVKVAECWWRPRRLDGHIICLMLGNGIVRKAKADNNIENIAKNTSKTFQMKSISASWQLNGKMESGKKRTVLFLRFLSCTPISRNCCHRFYKCLVVERITDVDVVDFLDSVETLSFSHGSYICV